MMKPTKALLWVSLAMSLSFRLAAADAPPPFVNPDAPEAPAVQPGASQVLTEPQEGLPADAGDTAPAAPQISDDQQIKNGMEIAYQLYHAEDYDACARATGTLLDRYPKKPLYWVNYLNGLALEHQGQYSRAIERYEKVREQAPRTTYSNAAVFRIGLCQMKSGQRSEAIYTLREIIENNPRSEYRLQAHIHLGNLYRRGRDWRQAQRIYRDIIRYYPNSSWSWTATLYLAETHAHAGRNSTAIHVYNSLLNDERVPLAIRAQAQMRIGDLYLADERWLEALHAFKVALRDYNQVPGVGPTSEAKIQLATQGRRDGRITYRPVRQAGDVAQAPADAHYRLGQEQEKVPYE